MTQGISIKTLIIGSILALTSALVLVVGMANTPAAAQTKEDVCAGLELTGAECDEALPKECLDNDPKTEPNPGDPKCTSDAEESVSNIIAIVINTLSVVVGVVCVVMIIIGGFKYVTSGGESAQTASAKNTILFALVGIVIVAFSQVIVRFVLTSI